jgi:hypothetical protein
MIIASNPIQVKFFLFTVVVNMMQIVVFAFVVLDVSKRQSCRCA